MMRTLFTLLALFLAYQVLCQSIADVSTIAITPTSAAQGSATAVGQQAAAQSTSIASRNSAFSSASAVASGGTGGTVRYPTPRRVRYTPAPSKTCHDIVDDECPEIDDYDKCAFCDLGNYKGYGVSYEIKTYKYGKTYYTVYELKKDCDGDLIYEGRKCPKAVTCDDYLDCIKGCSDTYIVTYSSGQRAYKVTRSCLSHCGVTQNIFDRCFH